MNNLVRVIFIILILLPASDIVSASNLAREKRLADEIADSILDGEVVYLEADRHKFLAIDMQPDNKARGSIVILHGRGYHPDWADVAHPLRVGLAENGWRTLSLQMPVLEKDATYYDYVPVLPEAFPRLEAALDYLGTQKPIIVIAHSCGVHMAMAWFEHRGSSGIDGFVGIGMGATDYGQHMAHPFHLDKLRIPVLDIYGSGDYPAVRKFSDRRLMNIARSGQRGSAQVMVADADHYFHDRGEVLTQEIDTWLDRNFRPE